jgi:hypothetical protein
LTFPPLLFGYSIFVAREARNAGPVLISLASWCLGGGLAAAYLLPALTHGGFVQQQQMFTEHLSYRDWFFFHPPLTWGGQSPPFLVAVRGALLGDRSVFKIFITAVTTAQVVLCWLGVAAIRLLDRERKASAQLMLAAASAVAASGYYVLNLRASAFLWERLPLLSRIQFPWRVNAELLVCVALIGACLITVLLGRPREDRGRFIAWAVAAGVASLLVVNIGNSLQYAPVTREAAAAMLRNYVSKPEHLAPRRESPEALFKDGVRAVFVSGAGEAAVAEWAARRIDIDVAADRPGTLAIAEQFYPGWSAVITPAGEHVAVDRLSGQYGILAVDVPAGHSRVSLRLGWTPNERLGWQVSAISGSILLLLLCFDWLKRCRLTI